MPRRRRSKIQIYSQILTTCRDDAVIKTQIVYDSYLNFNSAGNFLDILLKRNLIEYIQENDSIYYKTTAKGKRVLRSLQEIEKIY